MIISIENQKGGVGKTTIAIHIGETMADQLRSLLEEHYRNL